MAEEDISTDDMATNVREMDQINFNIPVKSDNKLPDKDLKITTNAVYDCHEPNDGGNLSRGKNVSVESSDEEIPLSSVCQKLSEMSTRSSSSSTDSSSEDDERPECDMNEYDLEKRYRQDRAKSIAVPGIPNQFPTPPQIPLSPEKYDTSTSGSCCEECCACDGNGSDDPVHVSSDSRSTDSSRNDNDVHEYEESEDESATLYSSYSSPRVVSPTCDDSSDDSSETSRSSSCDDPSDDDFVEEYDDRGLDNQRGDESDTDTEDSDFSSSDISCEECSMKVHRRPSITEDDHSVRYSNCYVCGSALYDSDSYECHQVCSTSSSPSGSESTTSSTCTSPEIARYVSFESLMSAEDDHYMLGSEAETVYSDDEDQMISTMSESSSESYETEDSAIIVCNCCECYRDCLVGGGSSEVEDHRSPLVDASTSTDDLQEGRDDATVPLSNSRNSQVMFVSVYVCLELDLFL